MIRKIIFQIHWALGISVGFVLVVVSLTGLTMAFEDEIMRALSPGIVTVEPPKGAERLSPDAILARVREQQPGRQVASLVLASPETDAARVVFLRDPRDADEDRRSYVDPYDGRLLGLATGEHFFRTVRALHRWLLVPGDGRGFGRQITGIAAIGLVYFALSGLWLRWPRRPLDWRQWLVLDLTRSGRSFYRALHVVIGGWVVVFYLLSGFTGLWWSYDWYKSGVTWLLTGASHAGSDIGAAQSDPSKAAAVGAHSPRPAANPKAITMAVAAVRQDSGRDYREIVVTLPKSAKPIRLRALPFDARYDQAYDDFLVAADSGRILSAEKYVDKTIGQSLVGGWLSFHKGSYFGLPGRIVLAVSTAAMPLFPITGWLLYLDRRKKRRARVPYTVNDGTSTMERSSTKSDARATDVV